MRIDNIQINNFLSFDAFSWHSLDPHLNVVIGPNGAGKTNLIHALRALVDVIRQQDTVWREAAHRGHQGLPTTIIIDVEFTGEWEHLLLATFFAADFANERVLQEIVRGRPSGGGLDPSALARFSQRLVRDLRSEDLSWFFRGRFVVTYDGLRWSVTYQSRPEAPAFRLGLTSTGYDSIFFGNKQDSIWQSGSNVGVWLDGLDPEPASSSKSSLTGAGAQPQRSAPVKDAVLTALAREDTGEEMPPFAFSALPSRLSSTHGVSLRIELPTLTALATHQAFQTATGVALEANRIYDARWVFQRLLEHSLIFTDNLRQAPRYEYTLAELNVTEIDINSGVMLPLFLFQRKNSVVAAQRNQFTKTNKLFRTLTNREFDVVLSRASDMHGRGQDDQLLRLSVITSDISEPGAQGETPLQYSGAGVIEALFLSAIIEGSEDRVVLLDEPASNLYPLVQTALLQEIQRRPQNQSLIITHAPALISPEALSQVSRLSLKHGRTHRAAIDSTGIDREEAEKLRKELRRSLDLRALFFSRAVILVEGETELGALPVWFDKLGYSLTEHDIGIYTVSGDQNFSIPVRCLHGLAVPWVIVCDGKVIGDAQPPRIVRQLEKAGIEHLPVTSGQPFRRIRESLEDVGVFTVAEDATSPAESFEALPVIQINLDKAKHEVGATRARTGRYIAEEYDPPAAVSTLLDHIRKYLRL